MCLLLGHGERGRHIEQERCNRELALVRCSDGREQQSMWVWHSGRRLRIRVVVLATMVLLLDPHCVRG
eukprot:scaffold175051_cov27-Tisochrysis_lutea.AAC.6